MKAILEIHPEDGRMGILNKAPSHWNLDLLASAGVEEVLVLEDVYGEPLRAYADFLSLRLTPVANHAHGFAAAGPEGFIHLAGESIVRANARGLLKVHRNAKADVTVAGSLRVLSQGFAEYLARHYDDDEFDARDDAPVFRRVELPLYAREIRVEGRFHLLWANLEELEQLDPENVLELEQEPGVYLGEGVRVHRTARITGPVLIGSGVTIGPGSVIGPDVVIESDCFIAGDCVLSRSLVCRDTYLGRGARAEGAVISAESVGELPVGSAKSVLV